MNGRFASALDRSSGFCYRCKQDRKAELRFPASNHFVILRSFGVYTKSGIDPKPINTPTTTTLLSSIRQNGDMLYTLYSGGTTAERFRDYIENVLYPSLDKHAVVIMDNMRSHHAKIVKQFLDEKGINYVYLPPYSPDLNPIEKLWSKLKAFLRKLKIRILGDLPAAVDRAFHVISCDDCQGWFRSCGICDN